jgi:hypothetical protein
MCAARVIKGLSFDVGDLVLLESWSERLALRMVVHLDHYSSIAEYEEVLTFHSGTNPLTEWTMWRTEQAVCVRPGSGRIHRYRSVAKAIESMDGKQRAVVS